MGWCNESVLQLVLILMGVIRVAGVSCDAANELLTLEVVSVHAGVVNGADTKKRRWTLIEDEAEFQPRSILVAALPALRQGERITLELAGAASLFDLKIRERIHIARRWYPLLLEWADLLYEPALEALGREVGRSAERIKRVERFSGLGPGLTPAGDDFIAGWITALRSTVSHEARGEIRKFYRAWQPDKTTWLSKWMILDAIGGYVWKRGKDLLSAMSRNDGGAVSKVAAEILNWGHTSGRAWLAGLARGFIELGN